MTVQIQSSALSNSTRAGQDGERHNIGHFLLAIDPTLVNPTGTTEDHVEELITAIKATGPNVLTGGEPEQRAGEERTHTGIPPTAALTRQIRGVVTAPESRFNSSRWGSASTVAQSRDHRVDDGHVL